MTSESEASARSEMIRRVSRHFEETSSTTGLAQLEERIEEAMSRVPRHRFVPPELAELAYDDRPLPIGLGQTISQPFIVALMIQLAALGDGARVLEIGTGSGYEAAVLGELVGDVYTIELVPELAERSRRLLEEMGYSKIHVRSGDGFAGWPESAPFDAILVTACASQVPEPLLEQLAVGGRLVVPVGEPRSYQELQVIEKTPTGEYVVRHVLPVAFVPLIHDEQDDDPARTTNEV